MEQQERITENDLRCMVSGAYSEFLMNYERLDGMPRAQAHVLRPGQCALNTMAAAYGVLRAEPAGEASIGKLARSIARAAICGARGSIGILLAELLQGVAKGLVGKKEATSSEFGKAFQYGIRYAQKLLPEKPEFPVLQIARAVAKGAKGAVREKQPLHDILSAALDAGNEKLLKVEGGDVSAQILFTFFTGCMHGLDGTFVSPEMSLALQPAVEGTQNSSAAEYGITAMVARHASMEELEEELKLVGRIAWMRKEGKGVRLFLHTHDLPAATRAIFSYEGAQNVELIDLSRPREKSFGVKDGIYPCFYLGGDEEEIPFSEFIYQVDAADAKTATWFITSLNSRVIFRKLRQIFGSAVEARDVQTKDGRAQAKKILQAMDCAPAVMDDILGV